MLKTWAARLPFPREERASLTQAWSWKVILSSNKHSSVGGSCLPASKCPHYALANFPLLSAPGISITKCLINIRCFRGMNFTAPLCQEFEHRTLALMGFCLYITRPIQWICSRWICSQMPICPKSLCDSSLGQKRSSWAMHCLLNLSQRGTSPNHFYCQRRKKLGESGIVLIRAHEVYKKIQFVDDAGRWKTTPLTELLPWALFTFCQASQSDWSIMCMF